MNKKKILGAWGESIAVDFYRKRRFTIEAIGFQCRFGEIDLIVANRKFLVFVEVKTRNGNSLGRPSEAVNKQKQKKLQLTAMKYMESEPINIYSRFDVFEVWQNEGRIYKFNCKPMS